MKKDFRNFVVIVLFFVLLAGLVIYGFHSLRETAAKNNLIYDVTECARRYLPDTDLYVSYPVSPTIITDSVMEVTEEDIGYLCFLFVDGKCHTSMPFGYTDGEYTCSYSYFRSEAIDQSVAQGLPVALYYTKYGLYLYACGEYKMLAGIGSAREEAIALMEPYVSSKTGFFEITLIPCSE